VHTHFYLKTFAITIAEALTHVTWSVMDEWVSYAKMAELIEMPVESRLVSAQGTLYQMAVQISYRNGHF